MEANQTTALVIKEHDFQEVKNALKKYTGQAKDEVELNRVPACGGLFNLGNHKVTGYELNQITTQIQDCLIGLNHLSQGLVDEFGQVYKAFEYLDKDYISGIVASIKAAEKVSLEEQKDRKDIKELIEQHEQSIAVLKKFKADIEEIKHLADIDKVWDLIEKQTKLSKELGDYIADLSKLKHIKDVDRIYHDLENVIADCAEVSEQQVKYLSVLNSVREFCDSLEKIKHIEEIDELWDSTEDVVKDIECIKKSIETQSKAISSFDELVQGLQTEQKHFMEENSKSVFEFRESLDNKVQKLIDAQTVKLNNIEAAHTQAAERLAYEQRETLSAIEKAQNEKYDFFIKEQSLSLEKIEKTQKEALEQLSENQSMMLEQISNEQSANWENAIKLLEEEKAALNEQVATIKQKIKFSYFVAGGAVALTIIQLLLSVLGVL